MLEAKLGDDVGAYLRRRGGRVGVDGRPGKRLPQDPELAILRPEVMPPLADAVRLIDREERRTGAPEPLRESRQRQPLGRDVEQVHPRHREVALDGGALLPALAAVEVGGGNTGLAKRVHLIFHERNQRRDDDGQPAEVRSRRLVQHA